MLAPKHLLNLGQLSLVEWHASSHLLQCIRSHLCLLVCSVHFDAQSAGKGEEIPLVKAAKTVFDNSNPSFWSLVAMVAPAFLLPVIRLLANKFPGKNMTESREAFETLYGASDALIEVRRTTLCSEATKLRTFAPLYVLWLQLLVFAKNHDKHALCRVECGRRS